jgi:hypothetical protein
MTEKNNIPFIDLLCNVNKKQFNSDSNNKLNDCNKSNNNKFNFFNQIDDNEEILNLLKDRLKLGRERYGHGVIVDDNTQKYGTLENDWELMALEEMLDGLIYTTASIIRYRRSKRKIYNDKITNDDIILNYTKKK